MAAGFSARPVHICFGGIFNLSFSSHLCLHSRFHFSPNMHSHNTTRQPIEVYIIPANLFHHHLQHRRVREVRQRLRQVVILFKSLPDNRAEQRSKFVEVEMEERTKDAPWRMTYLQADHSPSW